MSIPLAERAAQRWERPCRPSTRHSSRAGAEHRLPWGLLARAVLRRVLGDRTGAQADLDEATEIADRGQMKLHLADAHLERTRFHLAAGEDAAARSCLEEARRFVEETGYGRREGEVAFLLGRLEGSDGGD